MSFLSVPTFVHSMGPGSALLAGHTPHVGRKPLALSSQRICISEGVASGDVAPWDKSPWGHHSQEKTSTGYMGFPSFFSCGWTQDGRVGRDSFQEHRRYKEKAHDLPCVWLSHLSNLSTLESFSIKLGNKKSRCHFIDTWSCMGL